jgi:xanthine/uracil permease
MRDAEDDRSIGTLLGDLGRQVSTIVRKEIELARVEITSAVGRMGQAAAMTAAGGALIYAGLLVVLGAIVFALIDAGLDPWLAALIVGAVALVVGGIVTSMGVQRIRSTEIAPKQTAETVRENVEFVKEQVK